MTRRLTSKHSPKFPPFPSDLWKNEWTLAERQRESFGGSLNEKIRKDMITRAIWELRASAMHFLSMIGVNE